MRHSIRTLLLSFALTGALSVSLLVSTPASAATSLELGLVSKINASRAVYGLRALPIRSGLTWRAHDHSLSMARQRRLYHSDLTKVCCYISVGENVGYATTLYRVHRAFMNSSAHRANIMGSRWDSIGVGVVQAGGYLWVTEIFRDTA
jgi:uncharacterized protein YkwD